TAPGVRAGVRALGAAAGLAAGIPVGTSDQLGRQTWRRHPDRAAADAADGAFFADPFPEVVKRKAFSLRKTRQTKARQTNCGTSASAGRFPCMAMKRALFISCALMVAADVAGVQGPPGQTTPPARTEPTSPD